MSLVTFGRIMIISVASGKGGTGKTTVAVNLAFSLKEKVQFFDCDVEEPNAFIFLSPEIKKTFPVEVSVPEIDYDKCNFCGKCADICYYNSLAVIKPRLGNPGKIMVFENICHDCGACSAVCPVNAITEKKRTIGKIDLASVKEIECLQGVINPKEILTPAVIRQEKRFIDKTKTVIIDAPPGTTCPVVAAVNNSDFCLLVTEPTPFGLNDLGLAVEMLKDMDIPSGVVINRSGLGNNCVHDFCEKNNIPILMEIPFERRIAELYSRGIAMVEAIPEYKEKFSDLFRKIKTIVNKKN